MNGTTITILARRVMENRIDANEQHYPASVRQTYKEFAQIGEDMIIAEANRLIDSASCGVVNLRHAVQIAKLDAKPGLTRAVGGATLAGKSRG